MNVTLNYQERKGGEYKAEYLEVGQIGATDQVVIKLGKAGVTDYRILEARTTLSELRRVLALMEERRAEALGVVDDDFGL